MARFVKLTNDGFEGKTDFWINGETVLFVAPFKGDANKTLVHFEIGAGVPVDGTPEEVAAKLGGTTLSGVPIVH